MGGCFVFASLALLNATVNNSHSNRDIGIVSRTCVSVLPTQCVRIHVSTANDDDLRSITVRPWFDMVTDLEAQTFAKDTPPQRQQLILDGKRLKDDGRVLALRGVVAECTIQLVCVFSKDLLSAIHLTTTVWAGCCSVFAWGHIY